MTIGPEPRTRILCRSSPTRHAARLDLADELVEQVHRVVRPRPGLGVVLHAARGDVEQPDALDRPVVEVHVRELRLPEVGLQPLPGLAAHREAVVLRGDGDAARAQVLDRVVAAAVAERELERLEADGPGEQLVAEADAEHGQLPDRRADRLDEVAERGGVAGAGDEEDPVGAAAEHLVRGGRARQQLERHAARGEVAHDRGLDPRVERDDVRAGAVAGVGPRLGDA